MVARLKSLFWKYLNVEATMILSLIITIISTSLVAEKMPKKLQRSNALLGRFPQRENQWEDDE